MKSYVALLRGINSGSNPTIKMETLRNVFLEAGFSNVKTVLASGNVIFDAEGTREGLASRIEKEVSGQLGFSAPTTILPAEDVLRLAASNPFRGIPVTTRARLYVTFLSQGAKAGPELPYRDPAGRFSILGAGEGAVFSVVDLGKGMTPDLMALLDKEYGKAITTRNWNTIEKIVAALM
jgi:uncharacterized protein (DUF1697 family)